MTDLADLNRFIILFWYIYCSGTFIANFEQKNSKWVFKYFCHYHLHSQTIQLFETLSLRCFYLLTETLTLMHYFSCTVFERRQEEENATSSKKILFINE